MPLSRAAYQSLLHCVEVELRKAYPSNTTAKLIGQELGLPPTRGRSVSCALYKLVRAGRAVRIARGHYMAVME